MNHMKNQISSGSGPLPIFKNWFNVGSSWLKYSFITPLMLSAILFVFCLFYKIIVSYITNCVTELPTNIMMTRQLEATDQIYGSI